MALKKHYPDIAFSGNYVDPDEIDRYEVYTVQCPQALDSVGDAEACYAAIGTFAGGTSGQSKALVLQTSVTCDYPRTLRVAVTGTADLGGTATINGIDQFGTVISESIGFGTQAAGTPGVGDNGTKVFAEVTSGTFTYAGVGSGSANLGYNANGTETLFGLPCKIAATADVIRYVAGTNSVPVVINKGTIASFVDLGMHAVKFPKDLSGTNDFLQVWVKSSFNSATTDGKVMAGLTQAT